MRLRTLCVMPEFARLIPRLQAFLILQEAGQPLPVEEIAARVEARGGTLPFGLESLRKALSRGPYHKSLAGQYSVDHEHPDYWYDEFRTRPAPPRPPTPPPVSVAVDLKPSEPLTPEELEELDPPHTFSVRKKMLCCLDAFGSFPLESPPQVLLPARLERVQVQRSLAGRSLPLRLEGDQLVLKPEHPELRRVRVEVRSLLNQQRERQAQAARAAENRQNYRLQQEEQKRAAWEKFSSSRPPLVQVFLHQGGIAGSLLNLADLTFSDFPPEQAEQLLESLRSLDIVFGLKPRELCEKLGIQTEARLIDLSPPFKSRTVNRAGRTVHFKDVSAQLRMTLSISQPLGDPEKLADYWARSQWGKFFRRLHSDLKSLYQYYRYGVEHGCVRLRWGFREEVVPVSWNLGQEPTLREILTAAIESQGCVEVVLGGTPGFEERFSRAQRFWPTEIEFYFVVGRFDNSSELVRLPRSEISAIRRVLLSTAEAPLVNSAPTTDIAMP